MLKLGDRQMKETPKNETEIWSEQVEVKVKLKLSL
jgi:hypothetical protein